MAMAVRFSSFHILRAATWFAAPFIEPLQGHVVYHFCELHPHCLLHSLIMLAQQFLAVSVYKVYQHVIERWTDTRNRESSSDLACRHNISTILAIFACKVASDILSPSKQVFITSEALLLLPALY